MNPTLCSSPLSTLRKALLIISLLFCTWAAHATDYVFVYNGNYLGINEAGTGIQTYTTFDSARCVWTCVDNNDNESTLDNTSRALRITYNGNTRYLNGSTTNGSAPTLSETAQNVWRADGTRVFYRNGNNYYLYYRSNSWRTSRTTSTANNDDNSYARVNRQGTIQTDYRATIITSSPSQAQDRTSTPTISCDGLYGSTGIQMSHTELQGTYTPARTTITVAGTTYYKGSNGVYSATAPSTPLNPSYSWSIQSGAASITQDGVLSVSNTGTVTVRLTTTYAGSQTKTADFSFSVTQTDALNETVDPDITITPASATLDLGGTQVYEVPATLIRTRRTRVAFLTITPNGGGNFYKVAEAYTTIEPTIETTHPSLPLMAGSVQWTPSDNTAYTYFSMTSNAGSVTLTRSANLLSEDRQFQLNVEARYGDAWPGVVKNASAMVTIPFSEVDLTNIYNCSASSANLTVGQTATLSFEYQPQDQGQGRPHVQIEYTSSNTDVATVDPDGRVTAVGPGSATITIQSKKIDGTNGIYCDNVTIQVTTPAAQPTFSRSSTNANVITVTSATQDATIYYTINGGDPTVYSQSRTNGATITLQAGQTLRAIAANTSAGYTPSPVATFVNGDGSSSASPYPILSASDLSVVQNNPSNYYLVQADFDASSASAITNCFTGTFDGDFHVIKNLSHALFNCVNGGTVKNVTLKDVSISSGTNVGAIANTASGSSKIYNCGVLSGSVSGTAAVGGIVGKIEGNTKVVNNYSYATVSGGTYAAGIVGQNASGYSHFDDGTSIADWPRPASNNDGNFQANNQNRPANYNGQLNGGTIEVWRGSNLQNQDIRHDNLTNLPAGIYQVSLDLVINRADPSGIQFYLNGASNIRNSEVVTSNGYYEAHISRLITVGENGTIQFGFNLNNVNFNWMQWDNVRVEQMVEEGLTGDMFHEWSSYQAGATIVGSGYSQGSWGTAAGTVYGDGNVPGNRYADLTNYSTLVLTVSSGTPRLLFNRQSNDNTSTTWLEINKQNSEYVSSVQNGVWYIDLAKITQDQGYAHLNVIKDANWGNVNITNAVLYKNPSTSTMVMNCMFYGDITGGTNKYPVYGGVHIENKTRTNYNYFRNVTLPADHITEYNSALAALDKNLTRFEFYRSILNSNRKLVAWYISDDVANTDLVAKWVLDPEIAPYPILKPWGKYPSVINRTSYAADTKAELDAKVIAPSKDLSDGTNRYEGKVLGVLKVNLQRGDNGTGSNTTIYLPITDMDTNHFDYNYCKVQLPYYNDYFGGNYTTKAVTGWDIVSVVGGKTGTLSTSGNNAYNYADRKCTAKDANRTFAQGGFYYVPEGVTEITIKAHWANAVYLKDINSTYDNIYTDDGAYVPFAEPGTIPDYVYSTTYTSWAAAANSFTQGSSVYDNVIVLISNHRAVSSVNGASKPYSIMSIDQDHDNEPDYILTQEFNDRQDVDAIRFDFLFQVGAGMAQKRNDTYKYNSIGIYHPKGHFEVTETSCAQFTEFEYNEGRSTSAPLILMNSIVDQIVSAHNAAVSTTNYIILGGHLWMKAYTPGCHADNDKNTAFAPVTVLGGDYDAFYLTGMFDADRTNDVTGRVYTNGGRMKTYASSYQEQLDGNVFAKFDHSVVWEFYGGGVNASRPVKGDINVVINHSMVSQYVGGPKFGYIQSGKKVETKATGTVFGYYYGASYGGTSLRKPKTKDATGRTYDFNWVNGETGEQANKGFNDIRLSKNNNNELLTGYEIEFFSYAGGRTPERRLYQEWASLSLSTTLKTRSVLDSCYVKHDYYGGGRLGKVQTGDNDTLVSFISNSLIDGNAYGGGYSAAIPTHKVMNTAVSADMPTYNENTGIYSEITYPETIVYTWTNDALTNYVDQSRHLLQTTEPLTDLGKVAGNTFISVTNTHVKGYVFGGGNGSAVTGNTKVMILGGSYIEKNVYGGGHAALVGGNTHVVIGSDD